MNMADRFLLAKGIRGIIHPFPANKVIGFPPGSVIECDDPAETASKMERAMGAVEDKWRKYFVNNTVVNQADYEKEYLINADDVDWDYETAIFFGGKMKFRDFWQKDDAYYKGGGIREEANNYAMWKIEEYISDAIYKHNKYPSDPKLKLVFIQDNPFPTQLKYKDEVLMKICKPKINITQHPVTGRPDFGVWVPYVIYD